MVEEGMLLLIKNEIPDVVFAIGKYIVMSLLVEGSETWQLLHLILVKSVVLLRPKQL